MTAPALPCRPRTGGFTLLEVMVALGLLAASLVVIVGISSTNVRATQNARMITIASFLARAKIAELEDQVLEEGFVDNDQEDDGDFGDDGHPEVRWHTLIEKIELPTDVANLAQEKSQDQMMKSGTNPMMAMAGFMGGFMTTLIEPIRVGLEESVRRVSVNVIWDEPGRPNRSFDVVTFMTDPARLDLAMGAGAAAAAGLPGGAGATGAGGAGAAPAGGTIPGAGSGIPGIGASGAKR